MIVETSGGRHICETAEQHLDGVHLLDVDRNIILVIEKINDIKSVEDGEIVVVEQETTPTSEERFEALEAAVAMLCMPDISEV